MIHTCEFHVTSADYTKIALLINYDSQQKELSLRQESI